MKKNAKKLKKKTTKINIASALPISSTYAGNTIWPPFSIVFAFAILLDTDTDISNLVSS